ncbi:MAG: hypothetical protein OXT09_17200 [Myxococcales bacterium]|nr:hypothetical protein [Myxococcales bacterium]
MKRTCLLALGLLLALCGACGDDSSDDDDGDTGDGGTPGDGDGTIGDGDGDSTGGDGDSPGGPTIPELGEMLGAAFCAEAEACLGSDVIAQAFGDDGCLVRVGAQLEDGDFLFLEDAIEAGRIGYDPSAVTGCLSAIEGVGCEFETSRLLSRGSCAEVFTGSVELGGDCGMDPECTDGAFCKLDDSCPGTCTAPGAEGDPCGEDDQCEEGLSCPDDLGTCHDPADEGESCGGSATGRQCRSGLLCAGDDEELGITGTCTAQDEIFIGALDDPCDFDTATLCAEGLSCVIRLVDDAPVFTCENPVGSGEPCFFGAPSPCPDGEVCDADIQNGQVEGTCVPIPGEGEPCGTAGFGGNGCGPGLVCDTDDTCRAVGRLGDRCASGDACASDNCDGSVCIAPDECVP